MASEKSPMCGNCSLNANEQLQILFSFLRRHNNYYTGCFIYLGKDQAVVLDLAKLKPNTMFALDILFTVIFEALY